MNLRFPDDALFPDFLPAGLELGLDQADHMSRIFQQISRRYQNFGQRNKGNVHGCKVQPVLNIFRLHIAEIGFFHADNPIILPQFPCELPMPHINGIDLRRTVLQHTVRKTAG